MVRWKSSRGGVIFFLQLLNEMTRGKQADFAVQVLQLVPGLPFQQLHVPHRVHGFLMHRQEFLFQYLPLFFRQLLIFFR